MKSKTARHDLEIDSHCITELMDLAALENEVMAFTLVKKAKVIENSKPTAEEYQCSVSDGPPCNDETFKSKIDPHIFA